MTHTKKQTASFCCANASSISANSAIKVSRGRLRCCRSFDICALHDTRRHVHVHVHVFVCVRASQANDSNQAQIARFNSPAFLPLLQTMSPLF